MISYGVLWVDGTYTGGITDKHALAKEYAVLGRFGGKVYTVGSEDDPEVKKPVAPTNTWKAP